MTFIADHHLLDQHNVVIHLFISSLIIKSRLKAIYCFPHITEGLELSW